MKVEQVREIVHNLANDIMGAPTYLDADGNSYNPQTGEPYTSQPSGGSTSYFVAPDLSNVVDIGRQILDVASTSGKDYAQVYASLINHIGRVVFVDRMYTPVVPSLERSDWEYGSIIEKIDADMPYEENNVKWDLQNGTEYKQDVFRAPKNVRAKFFNDAVTFQIEMSFTEDQLKQSFSSASQLNSFFSMIATKIANKMKINFANLTRATINSFIIATLYRDYSAQYSTSTHTFNFASAPNKLRAINLLKAYNDEVNPEISLTKAECLSSPEFIRFATQKINLYMNRIKDMSTLFNIGGRERFTPPEKLHLVLLNEFSSASKIYLESDTFNKELVVLPNHEVINYWQGTGTDYSFDYTSKIHISAKVIGASDTEYSVKEVDVSGVIGVMFDTDAMGINNERQKTTSHYNANGDFVNNFYKAFGRYYTDHDENCVVFFVA